MPEEFRRLGVQVSESTSGFLAMVALTSKIGNTPVLEIGNYANNILDELRRALCDADLARSGNLAGYNLSAAEALAAVQEQNGQTAGGGLGRQPLAKGAEFNARIVT